LLECGGLCYFWIFLKISVSPRMSVWYRMCGCAMCVWCVAVCGCAMCVWECGVRQCGCAMMCVRVCGSVWQCVAVCGSVWLCDVCVVCCSVVVRCVCGSVWQCVAVCGCAMCDVCVCVEVWCSVLVLKVFALISPLLSPQTHLRLPLIFGRFFFIFDF